MTDLNQVLRPKEWNQVAGQGAVKELCQRLIAEEKFPKFSIFHGPTGVGKSCISELIAIQLTKWTANLAECPNIKKFNMASLIGKRDIVDIISEIFKFKTTGTTIFILEEVQVLKKEEQSPFLEELTKIPENVYIMMCTTKVTALLPEMRNRAILFQLTQPTLDECKDFITDILDILHYAPMTDEAKTLLIKASNFTPRSIVKHIELLASGNVISQEDISKFFNTISNATYIEVVYALTSKDVNLYECTNALNKIIKGATPSNFVVGLRDFICQLLIEKASQQQEMALPKDERNRCNALLSGIDEVTFVKMFDILSKVDFYHMETSADALALCIKIKIALMNATPQSIIKDNNSKVSEAIIANKKLARQATNNTAAVSTRSINSLDTNSNLSGFGIEDTVYEE